MCTPKLVISSTYEPGHASTQRAELFAVVSARTSGYIVLVVCNSLYWSILNEKTTDEYGILLNKLPSNTEGSSVSTLPRYVRSLRQSGCSAAFNTRLSSD